MEADSGNTRQCLLVHGEQQNRAQQAMPSTTHRYHKEEHEIIQGQQSAQHSTQWATKGGPR